MRPIEKKVLDKVGKNGLTLDEIWEIVDNTQPSELKKSYPDDSHFQSGKYFARNIMENLLRTGKVIKEGNKIMLPKELAKNNEQ